MDAFTLTRPDDWHLHLRDGPALAAVIGASARVFRRAIVMPNLRPPVTTVKAAAAYRERILAARPAGSDFEPLMTLYLTDRTSNSETGVTALTRAYPAIAAMERHGVVLSLHGEVTDPDVDVFDRERVFVERHLAKLVSDFPALKIVVEHVTTREAAEFVLGAPANVAATITPQHLRYSRNALFAGGLRPHWYCLPVLKRETHRAALLAAATSGSPKFFLGTDSAPHARGVKESACCGAGCYTAPLALEVYAEVFEDAGALDRLEAFASVHGAAFYGLPRNTDTVTLMRTPWQVPADYSFGAERLVPLRAGETLRWQLQ
jgi:dihydroorotase